MVVITANWISSRRSVRRLFFLTVLASRLDSQVCGIGMDARSESNPTPNLAVPKAETSTMPGDTRRSLGPDKTPEAASDVMADPEIQKQLMTKTAEEVEVWGREMSAKG